MKASVVICTHNRKSFIAKSLASVLQQNFDKRQFEVIVVDNGSTDGTSETARAFLASHSKKEQVRLVKEPTLGLSQARNRGLSEAQGQFVLYLDDDAVASPNWLLSMIKIFESDPKIAVVGGRIDPLWPSDKIPSWLSSDLWGHFSVIDWGPGSHDLKKEQWLAGANIGYQKKALIESGGFSGKLGRKGKMLLSCEESLLNYQISKRGYRIVYSGESRVEHYVMPERMTPEWLMQRSFWQGISESVMAELLKTNRSHFVFKLFVQLPKGLLRFAKARYLKFLVLQGRQQDLKKSLDSFHRAGKELGLLFLPWV